APLVLLVRSDRAPIGLVLFLLGFHVMVYAGVGIIFLPHCVAILSILPWERLGVLRRWTTPAAAPDAAPAPPPGAPARPRPGPRPGPPPRADRRPADAVGGPIRGAPRSARPSPPRAAGR